MTTRHCTVARPLGLDPEPSTPAPKSYRWPAGGPVWACKGSVWVPDRKHLEVLWCAPVEPLGQVDSTPPPTPEEPHPNQAPPVSGAYLLEVPPHWRSGRGRWWATDAAGYTDRLGRAGLFSEEYVRSVDKSGRDTRVPVETALADLRSALEHLSGLTPYDGPESVEGVTPCDK